MDLLLHAALQNTELPCPNHNIQIVSLLTLGAFPIVVVSLETDQNTHCQALTMPPNRAAWQDRPKVELSIRPTPYPSTLAPTEILLQPHAWAINPADHLIQDPSDPSSDSRDPYSIMYPLILGEDAAGKVISVGSAAMARFKPDDRVLAVTIGALKTPDMGGFQEYVIVEAGLACHIPDFLSFAEASVLPLCVATAAHALFSKNLLALPDPILEARSIGKSILIWGGSSAVGCNAIQLAKAAGLEIFSTCSLRNFGYLKSLGVSKVFDYSDQTVIRKVVVELDCTICVGIFQATGSIKTCLQISEKAKQDLFVATATPISENIPNGVRAARVSARALIKTEIRPTIFEDFLPKALAQRKYTVAPEPLIMGTKGLEGIQAGFDKLRNGVSAKKVVVVAD